MKKGFVAIAIVFSITSLFCAEEEDKAIINQAFLDLSKKENLDKFKQIKEDKTLIENEFLQLNSMSISNSPQILKNSDTITIMMHPEFPRTMVFEKIKITNLSAYPSDSVAVYMDEQNYNTIEIKTNNAFKKGVVVLKYLDENNNKKVQNILVESYAPKVDNKIYLTTIVKNYVQQKPFEILKAYQKLYGSNPKDGSSIVINNEVYRFLEDKINGFITFDNKKYRIEHSYNTKAN